MKKLGFTLAEVLITLTIIGVIAALTIPNLMKKHMQKEMEVAFNKSVALLNQGLSLMAYEEGAGLKQAYATWDGTTYSGDINFSNFKNYMKIEKTMFSRDLYKKGIIYKGYNKETLSETYPLSMQDSVYVVYVSPGGMTYRTWINSSTINIIVDTNGEKGPNRSGYDYFLFSVSDQDRISYPPSHFSKAKTCSANVNDSTNGLGCAKYALVNKCPDDDSKTYWECLR